MTRPFAPRPVIYGGELLPHRPPFPHLPASTTFANPIFITINFLQHNEAVFPNLPWSAWSRTLDEWVVWVRTEPKLQHLQNVGAGDGVVVRELAAFLVIAAHLRRRMGESFIWCVGPRSKSAGEEDVLRDNDTEPDDEKFWSGPATGEDRGGTSGNSTENKGGDVGGKTAAGSIAEQWRLQQQHPTSLQFTPPRRSLWTAATRHATTNENATLRDTKSFKVTTLAGFRRTLASLINSLSRRLIRP
ncbi:hypothetical protein B0H19DRAFT_465982 [Mycena capillaripes]|nr:hypothetical protein B0H19DRAFT_465982 [Mycena capillaripes]